MLTIVTMILKTQLLSIIQVYGETKKAWVASKSGASHALLTAPAKGDIKNIVFGINDDILD